MGKCVNGRRWWVTGICTFTHLHIGWGPNLERFGSHLDVVESLVLAVLSVESVGSVDGDGGGDASVELVGESA